MCKEMDVIGVDIGGTHVRAGKVRNGKIISCATDFIPSEVEDPMLVTCTVIKTIKKVFDGDIAAIGIGIPSLVDRDKGIVYDVQNIPSWKHINLKNIIESEFNVSVFLDNDANCFAIGEYFYGKGANISSLVGLTIGTGIGAGIVVNGKLLQDSNCGAGEFGMLPYLDETYEDYCSGKYFKGKYKINGDGLFEKALNDDQEAIRIFDEFGKHVGNIIKAIMFTVDPEKIIIGGSVSKASRFFRFQMMKQLDTFPFSNARKKIQIEFSEILQPGLLGAAALCLGKNELITNYYETANT